MPELTLTQWLIMIAAALILGMSKTGLAGVGILAIPLAAMVIPARESTGLILPMLVVGDIMAVLIYRRHAVWKYVLKLLPCAVAGILLGFILMNLGETNKPIINDNILKPFIGIVILILLALNAWRTHRIAKSGEIHIPDGLWFAITMGVLAGIVTMMANAAGPIIVIYLLAMRLPKHAFIGTGAWYFLILNTFKIPFSAYLGLVTTSSLIFNATLAPVIIIGGLAGVWLVKYIPEKPFTWMVQILAAAAAIHLIVSSLRF
ncbi:MAG: sulfite exporter TauE/SafE family protein [Phycisphaerales bacterium]|nr:sulfite exporter TauE/SafE family protein [Phycisphaerales bacterium]